MRKIALTIVGTVVLAALGWFLVHKYVGGTLNIVDSTQGLLTAEEQSSLYEGFRKELYDPGSMQVRRLVRSTTPGIVCGEVNSKDKAGAYSGFIPFSAGLTGVKAQIAMPPSWAAKQMRDASRDTQRKLGCKV